MGGIEAILSAMKDHKSSALVQEYGCSALGDIALNGRYLEACMIC